MARTKYDEIAVVVASNTGVGASLTVNYPAGRSAADYLGGTDHWIISNAHPNMSAKRGDFTVTFGASNMTVTLQGIGAPGGALVAGETIYLNLDRAEADGGPVDPAEALADPLTMSDVDVVKIALGAPDTADANGVVESQAATAAGGLATGINGALAADGVATFDVPRNVVAAWTGTSVLTVTGTDAYGNTVVESSASGTSLAGKKAFKTVTGVSVSADVTGLTVGTGDVLGLPVFLADAGDVMAELEDGAAASAGTVVAGATATPTATTGDVRGTYDPNSAANGTKKFDLIVAVRSTSYKGAAQFAG